MFITEFVGFFLVVFPLYRVMQIYTCLKNNLDQLVDEKIFKY